jgi:hypothetical protein
MLEFTQQSLTADEIRELVSKCKLAEQEFLNKSEPTPVGIR